MGTGGDRRRTNQSIGQYRKWYLEYIGTDPVNLETFPRFQVWNDHDWTDYQEGINSKLRNHSVREGSHASEYSATAQVDLGESEGT